MLTPLADVALESIVALCRRERSSFRSAEIVIGQIEIGDEP